MSPKNVSVTLTVSELIWKTMLFVLENACRSDDPIEINTWNNVINQIVLESNHVAHEVEITLDSVTWRYVIEHLIMTAVQGDPQWIEWRQNVQNLIESVLASDDLGCVPREWKQWRFSAHS